eukprot:gene32611-39429_t
MAMKRKQEDSGTGRTPRLGPKTDWAQPPKRSGIGLDANEWEAPERLSTSIQRQTPSAAATPLSLSSGRTTKESVSSGRRGDEWEMPTPMRSGDESLSVSSAPPSSVRSKTVLNTKLLERLGYYNVNPPSPTGDNYDAAEEDEDFDRDFYLSEEGGGVHTEDSHTRFVGDNRPANMKAPAMGQAKIAGMSARASQLHADQEMWEENRLLQSGVASYQEKQTAFDDEEENRVTLIVHHVKPPFLDQTQSFSMQQTSVSVVKDPSSDLAQNARKGSNLLREVREKKDSMKSRQRFWELGGSKMGNIIGVAAPDDA